MQIEANPHVGAVGVALRLAIVDEDGDPLDLTTASVKKMRIKPQGRDTYEKEATVEGAGNNVLVYVTTSSEDLPVGGEYAYQARVVTPSWADHSTKAHFEVLRPL